MQVLVTGTSGYVGAALVPRLQAAGHRVRGYGRSAARITAPVDDVVEGDAIAGTGLERALEGVEVAYFLIHSMEGAGNGFADLERQAAEHFGAAAADAGVRRIVYLGGLVPADGQISRHLASRLAVEELLLAAAPESIAMRASIVIGARSRSFRFLVRLVERMPVLALPAWRDHRTAPVDGRDLVELLARAGDAPEVTGQSLDIAGPEVLSYGAMIERIRDYMLVGRPKIQLGSFEATPLTSRIASALAGEDHELVGPLMEGLGHDLLPRDDRAARLLGVRLHSFDAAVEHALRVWEEREPLRAR